MVVAAAMVVERTDRGDRDVHDLSGAQRPADPRPRRPVAAARAERRAARPAASRPRATKGATSPARSRCGTSRGTSTRSATTRRSACTCGSGACRIRESACTPRRSAARAGRRSCWSIRLRRSPTPATTRRRSKPTACAPSSAARRRLSASGSTLHGTGAGARGRVGAAARRARAPVEVELDLEWETDGIPYAWRQATRYEIPCRVTGTVRVGRRADRVPGPGQRDHSWGSRDWWAVDWMWSALHLDDGTHTHAVAIPQMPGFGVGYVQHGRGDHRDRRRSRRARTIAGNGLIERARIASGPDPAGDRSRAARLRRAATRGAGRPRCRCFRARCAACAPPTAGPGAGWVEWNRVQQGDQG